MPGTPAHGVPDDVTIITTPAPKDAATVAATVARTLAAARDAGLPQPDYLHQHAGHYPSVGLQFTLRADHDPWTALRTWAGTHDTEVTATESTTRPGTWTARAKWHTDGIEFEAYATITTTPPESAP
jgi:hypothetical protein